MGYWANTRYINQGDIAAVERCLTQVLALEGMRPIARPPERERVWYEPMQYATSERNNLWGIAMFPGTEGWTIIKSAPLELLAERPAHGKRMRVVDLCDRLGVPGAMLSVYDSSGCVAPQTQPRTAQCGR